MQTAGADSGSGWESNPQPPTQRSRPAVLKTEAPTGTQPLPRPIVAAGVVNVNVNQKSLLVNVEDQALFTRKNVRSRQKNTTRPGWIRAQIFTFPTVVGLSGQILKPLTIT